MNTGMKKGLLLAEILLLAALVPSPALVMEMKIVSRYGAVVALAALLGVCLVQRLRMADVKKQFAHANDGPIGAIFRPSTLDLALWCIPAAFVCARLSYCLARFSFYFLEMGPLSVLRTWEGGFMLYGAALGALGAAALVAKRQRSSIPETLDALAAPGLLAVALCRLGEWGTGEGVGAWMENPLWMRLPFAVMNEYEEWQLAVFLLEAFAALVLFALSMRREAGEGARITWALLAYACCQVLLESMRMDSCLKIGFVRISQVISGVVILGITAMRAYRAGGRPQAVRRAAVVGVCVALVGGIEWALDKTPLSNVLLYAVMAAVCAALHVNASRFARMA